MKVKMFFSFFCFSLAITGKTLAADITITGETYVYSSTNFTYYATPPTPIPAGTTYTWDIEGATIVEQNTDPNAGPIYCVVRFPRMLGQNEVTISDNHGNSGTLYITMNGFSSTNSKKGDIPVKQPYQPLVAILNKSFMIAQG
jgi:hypothetical protein